jgi:hypothetical protein
VLLSHYEKFGKVNLELVFETYKPINKEINRNMEIS